MDSALRPRDIQARIRSGASPEEVAEAAGVPVTRIEAFAAPVLAERDHVSGLARTHPVRRRGETTSHRTLRNAVADALSVRGVDEATATWDSWKHEDRRWTVKVSWVEDGTERAARFIYDVTGRFSVATDDEGRELIGDGTTDDLALVRALQEIPPRPEPRPRFRGTPPSADRDADPSPDQDTEPYPEHDTDPDTAWSAEPRQERDTPSPEDVDDDSADAFHDGELQEVDGVYDIVAPTGGDLDVLYDMLSSFDEDSVKIYAGLMHPKEDPPLPEAPPVMVETVPPETGPSAPSAPQSAPARAAAEPADAEPEQQALIEEDLESPDPRPKTKRQRRKRAAVPSWDEIMFGSPHPKD